MTNEATDAAPPTLDHLQAARAAAVDNAARALKSGGPFNTRLTGSVQDIIELAEYIVSSEPWEIVAVDRKTETMDRLHDLRVKEDLDNPGRPFPFIDGDIGIAVMTADNEPPADMPEPLKDMFRDVQRAMQDSLSKGDPEQG